MTKNRNPTEKILHLRLSTLTSPPPLPTTTSNKYEALADTAAAHNILEDETTPYYTGIIPATGPEIQVANGEDILPHNQATVPLVKEFSKKAQHSYIFNDIKNCSLISIGQLCDDDCLALFSKYHLQIIKSNKVIITGKIGITGLWIIPLIQQQKLISSLPSPNIWQMESSG